MVVFTLIGILVGSYFGFTKILNTYAINDTLHTWEFNLATANSYTYDTNVIEITNVGASTGVNKVTNGDFETDLSGWTGERDYLLRDEFTDTRSPGNVNGTLATPGPGIRTVADTGNKISIGSGNAVFASNTINNQDPTMWYGSVSRTPGRLLSMDLASVSANSYFGYDVNQSGTVDGVHIQRGGSLILKDGSSQLQSSTYEDGRYILVLKNSGAYYFYKTNGTYKFLGSFGTSSTTTYYPAINNSAATGFTLDNVKIPTQTWLPTPLAYDTFTRANGSIGNTESIGPDSQTTPSLTWNGSTWSISNNGLVNNPSTGNELLTNNSFTSWIDDNPIGWSIYGTETPGVREINEVGSGETYGGSGTGSLNFYQSSPGVFGVMQTVLTPGRWYKVVSNVSATSATDWVYLYLHNQVLTPNWTTVGTYTHIGKALDGSNFYIYKASTANNTLDDISVKELPLSSLIATVQASTPDVISEANLSIDWNKHAGLVLNVDSASNPQNFVLAYL